MARITQAEGQKRREFALRVWRENPELAIPKMNDLIFEEFQGRMNSQQLYALRAEARKAVKYSPKKSGRKRARAAAAAHAHVQAPAKAPVAETKPRAVAHLTPVPRAELHRDGDISPHATLIPLASADQGSFLKIVTDKLRADGVCSLDVVIHDGRFAIIEKAAS